MRSMTGCGAGAAKRDGWEVTAEVKSVNHRFLDIGLRLPRTLSFLEPVIRAGIAAKIKRGHIETYITVKNAEESSATVSTDLELAKTYYEAARRIAEATGAANNMTTAELMKLEGVNVLSEREMDQDLMSGLCTEALDAALDLFPPGRARRLRTPGGVWADYFVRRFYPLDLARDYAAFAIELELKSSPGGV